MATPLVGPTSRRPDAGSGEVRRLGPKVPSGSRGVAAAWHRLHRLLRL